MLSYQEMECLEQRKCFHCDNTLEYNMESRNLQCSVCGSSWNYNEYKQNKALYNKNPDAYITLYTYEKCSK